jgi:hypothetical protein
MCCCASLRASQGFSGRHGVAPGRQLGQALTVKVKSYWRFALPPRIERSLAALIVEWP